jgi:hypothetical protein
MELRNKPQLARLPATHPIAASFRLVSGPLAKFNDTSGEIHQYFRPSRTIDALSSAGTTIASFAVKGTSRFRWDRVQWIYRWAQIVAGGGVPFA